MNIKQSIITAISLFVLVLAIFTTVGYSANGKVSRLINHAAGRTWNAATGAMEAQIALEQQLNIFYQLHAKKIDILTANEKMANATDRETVALDRLRQQGLMDASNLEQLNQQLAKYHSLRDSLVAELQTGEPADPAFKQFNDSAEDLLGLVSKLESAAHKKMAVEAAEMSGVGKDVRAALIICFLFGVIAAIFLYLLLNKTILTPIANTTEKLRQLSMGSGDLRVRLPEAQGNELGQLSHSFNRFVEKLQQLMGHVQSSNHSLIAASMQVTQSVGKTSAGANAQLEEIARVADSVQKVSASLEEVGDFANSANQVSDEAANSTHGGNHMVAMAQQGVDQITSEVKRASQVISHLMVDSQNINAMLEIIRSIAEQTNLLAVNAAIEAARAGHTGRGFTLVAEEVRSLALRTQESTKAIETIVNNLSTDSVRAVEVMTSAQKQAAAIKERIAKTSDVFADIVALVDQIKIMNADIVRASEDEKKQMAYINQSINAMLQQARTHQHAGATADMSRQHLEQQVVKIDSLIQQFRT